MTTKNSFLTTLALAFFSQSVNAASDFSERLENTELIFSFQGKGTSVGYDAGVFTTLVKEHPHLTDNKIILTGNSSGSIPVAFLACHGISADSITALNSALVVQTPSIKVSFDKIRQHAENFFWKFSNFIRTGEIPEIPTDIINPFINTALNVSDYRNINASVCFNNENKLPKISFAILASNQEVLDNRDPSKKTDLRGLNEKNFNGQDFSVTWKPEVYRFYQRKPDEFNRKHALLKLGESSYVGQACTYFVSADLFYHLSQVPAQERLCDLRLVDTPADLALAVRASVSEPSYFPRVRETNTEKLLTRPNVSVKTRDYWGGFSMQLVGQDIRRLLPSAYVYGSGCLAMDKQAESFLAAISLLSSNQVMRLSEYWSDISFIPGKDLSDKMLRKIISASEEFAAGVQRAEECFAIERKFFDGDESMKKQLCRPAYIDKPGFLTAFPNAMNGTSAPTEALSRGRGFKTKLAP